MKKKQKWTVFSILGVLILLVFAAICIAPFIYMVIMSFTQSTTLMLHWSDINFGDFTNFNYVLKRDRIYQSTDKQCDRCILFLSV